MNEARLEGRIAARTRIGTPAAGLAIVLAWLIAIVPAGAADEPATLDAEQVKFFDREIRPLLAHNCYECHNSRGDAEGDLVLDYRDGLLEGGTLGPAVIPGEPDRSPLIQAVRHENDLRMPQSGPKLSEEEIAALVRWVEQGAADPRDEPPAAEELDGYVSWEAVRERRAQWWSFQPIRDAEPPTAARADWPSHPVDRFVRARLDEAGLEPRGEADRRTLIRRVSLTLTGLPPTPEQVRAFVEDESTDAYERLVDRLLASPQFGERWARHWMDWFRFAESHGSENDPAIPYAYRYRDYLIRALNADVGYDQLIREHFAGDLLASPRINEELGINESAIGTAHFRMVPHGFAPTDALDELVTFTENQIDVATKGAMALTVACARCHDHKFDPISQADYHAMYSMMTSTRPATVTVDAPGRHDTAARRQMAELKAEIRGTLAEAWLGSLDELAERLADPHAMERPWAEHAEDVTHPLHALAVAAAVEDEAALPERWRELSQQWRELAARHEASVEGEDAIRWRLADAFDDWHAHGVGMREGAAAAGAFHILPEGDRLIANIYPAGVYSHLVSSRDNGALGSPRFKVESGRDQIWFRVAGGETPGRARHVVQNYPRPTGLIYDSRTPNAPAPRWERFDVAYWQGDHMHFEITTARDAPTDITDAERSWFGITDVIVNDGTPPVELGAPLGFALPREAIEQAQPRSLKDVAALYRAALADAVEAWRAGEMSDRQAEFLGFFVRERLLANSAEALPEAAALIERYRELERELPGATRAPGIAEGDVIDKPLFERGNHKEPTDVVPRRFLEVFDDEPFETSDSGRLAFAEHVLDPQNPLTSRVIVNRLWHHVFGRGIVATPDNFGRLGEKPSHPELLDYLATRMQRDGWSLKQTLRLLVTSETFKRASRPTSLAREQDPTNALLSHYTSRRLEAEAVRDMILAVTGELDPAMFGPSVEGESTRRSVYVRVQRNDLDPFLSAFDLPEALSTRGRRDITNVPAQSLALLNDPWVIERAERWGSAVAEDSTLSSDDQRIEHMFEQALGRPPSERELEQVRGFLGLNMDERTREEVARIDEEVAELRAEREAIVEPVRQRLTGGEGEAEPPSPIARWSFEGDLRDAVGSLHGRAEGGARVEDGELVLDGTSHVRAGPLDEAVGAKTLEAWVRLDNLDQRGGGVMTVERLDGEVFDSIVFAEQSPREWMSGSEFFNRTQTFAGGTEAEADSRLVHLAIAYREDGTIIAYRDGERYGQPYQAEGPVRFAAEEARVVFGMRHTIAGGDPFLRGRIAEARLYDRALNDEQIAASAGLPPDVGEREILAAMSDAQRARHAELTARIDNLTARRETIAPPDAWEQDPHRRWQDLAHAMLNFKELIYVR